MKQLNQRSYLIKFRFILFLIILNYNCFGIDSNLITVGTTMDLSRGAKGLGNATKAGIELAIKSNDKKNQLSLSYYDDQYDAQKARNNLKKIIENNISLILCPVGNETIKKNIDVIKNKNAIVLFPLPSLKLSSSQYLDHCINFGPTYPEYAKVVAQHIISEATPKKVAIIYQDDIPGNALLSKSKQLFEKAKINVTSLPFNRNDIGSLLQKVTTIKQENPDSIGIFGPPYAIKKLIKKCGYSFCKDRTFFITALENNEILKFMKDRELKFAGASAIPAPQESNLPIMKEFCENAKKNKVKIDITAAQAYICTSIFIDIISRINGPISAKRCFNEFKKLKNYNFKGLNLTFNPKTHLISNKLWLHSINNDWKEMAVKASPNKPKN